MIEIHLKTLRTPYDVAFNFRFCAGVFEWQNIHQDVLGRQLLKAGRGKGKEFSYRRMLIEPRETGIVVLIQLENQTQETLAVEKILKIIQGWGPYQINTFPHVPLRNPNEFPWTFESIGYVRVS